MESSSTLTTIGALVAVSALVIIGMWLTAAPAASNTSTKTKTKASTSSSSRSSATKRLNKGSDSDDEDAGILRGYKQTTDGRKTSYFTRELSAADQQLLASNAGPKPISQATPASPGSGSSTSAASAWNSAGTFEERNLTELSHERLRALLGAIKCDLPGGGSVRITRVANVSGDCIVASARGKAKLICDLSCEVSWEIAQLGSSISGNMTIVDITADDDYDSSHCTTSSSSPKVATFVRSESQGLQPAIGLRLKDLLRELQAAVGKQ